MRVRDVEEELLALPCSVRRWPTQRRTMLASSRRSWLMALFLRSPWRSLRRMRPPVKIGKFKSILIVRRPLMKREPGSSRQKPDLRRSSTDFIQDASICSCTRLRLHFRRVPATTSRSCIRSVDRSKNLPACRRRQLLIGQKIRPVQTRRHSRCGSGHLGVD